MSELGALMLDLFRGREDVIAFHNGAHFEPRPIDGKLSDKADKVAELHLGSKSCLGFYVMRPDETVLATCVDFDCHTDRPDAQWLAKTEALFWWLIRAGLYPIIERSQSGEGAHVWLFFSEPISAAIVRKWWEGVAVKIGIPFSEVYPRQDRLSGKGYGSLVRFPLWGKSEFLDMENEAAPLDALECLRNARKVDPCDLTLIAAQSGLGDLREALAGKRVNGTPQRIKSLLSDPHSVFARRWRGDGIGLGDPSRSGLAASICCELIRLYLPTAEIEAALRQWCKEQSYDKGLRQDWIARTVQTAYEHVAGKVSAKPLAVKTMQDAVGAYLQLLESGGVLRLPVGIDNVDENLHGGVALGEVAVIAGRPSHGKTAFALQWVENAARLGHPVLIVSEEMPEHQIGKRRLQSLAMTNSSTWRKDHVQTLRDMSNKHYGNLAPIYVVESVHTIDRIEAIVQQFAGLHSVRLVAIDYLQLLGGKAGNRNEEVAEISRRIKRLARTLNIAILLLCQHGRLVDQEARTPRNSDLKESGQIEQDADIILHLQWPWRISPFRHDKAGKSTTVPQPKDEFKVYGGKHRNEGFKNSMLMVCKYDCERQVFS